MKYKQLLLAFAFLGFSGFILAQKKSFDLTVNLTIDNKVKSSVHNNGRLFLFLNENSNGEPRQRTWPSAGNYIFARNIAGIDINQALILNSSEVWSKTPEWDLAKIPEGEYFIQLLWDQDNIESGINAPGNIYSEKQKININRSTRVNLSLSNIIVPREIIKHDLVREVDIVSDTLSKWWGKPIHVKASVLLPAGYGQQPGKAYPIRYNVAGYGGRYDRVNRIVNNQAFINWWQSGEAPQIITVYLDGEGPFGDSYQIDSENSGPYGYSLIHELAPYIENKYRGTNSAANRFVDGCSTGGWVSLGLQLYYPDFFDGVFSYSPDAIDFEHYQLINIYKDRNAFVNEYDYLRPVMRDVNGEPMMSLKAFIQYENVLGASNSYLNSGGQFSAHAALYGPKGKTGLPIPLFDPVTGDIDRSVATYWEKYDLKKYTEKNWATLGPKLAGKIFIWMGDMDNFYLNPATRAFDQFLKKTKDPVSDASIIFSPMEGHCSQFSDKTVLIQIQERIDKLNKK